MLLTPENSICKKNQKIIVSKDSRAISVHRAYNTNAQYDVRHYHLDGELIKQEKCCDYLLVNDSRKRAYFIELKGGNVDDAIPQLEAAASRLKQELQGYTFYYRIVASKTRTHNVKKSTFRKFQDKHGIYFKCENSPFEEYLDDKK